METRERLICIAWFLCLGAAFALCTVGGGIFHEKIQNAFHPAWSFGFLVQLELFFILFGSLPIIVFMEKSDESHLTLLFRGAILYSGALIFLFPAARLGSIPASKALLLQCNLFLFGLLVYFLCRVLWRLGRAPALSFQAAVLGLSAICPLYAYTVSEFSGKAAAPIMAWSPFVLNWTFLQGTAWADKTLLILSLVLLFMCISCIAASSLLEKWRVKNEVASAS